MVIFVHPKTIVHDYYDFGWTVLIKFKERTPHNTHQIGYERYGFATWSDIRHTIDITIKRVIAWVPVKQLQIMHFTRFFSLYQFS